MIHANQSATALMAVVSLITDAVSTTRADTKGWRVANGKWEIKGVVFQKTSAKDRARYVIVGDANWDNYTVETKARLDNTTSTLKRRCRIACTGVRSIRHLSSGYLILNLLS